MSLKLFLEFNESDLDPVKSFKIQDNLNPKIWDEFIIDKKVRENLLQIGNDFFNGTDISVDVIDIVLCGSLCNYNWSEKYSDYDLHIIVNYNDIDENMDLVEKLCDLSKKQWNQLHDIKVKGYEVEVAIQNKKDLKSAIKSGRMGGVYSLMNDRWIKKPEKVDFIPDEKLISEKGKTIMMEIDDIIEDSDNMPYEDLKNRIKKVWDKIKKVRERALEEEGEFGIGNLIFKFLRRNSYMGKIMKLKRESYDKQFESNTFSYRRNDKLTSENLNEVFEFDRSDVDNALSDVFDELSDHIVASCNFSMDGESIDNKELFEKIKNRNNIKISCEISFFLNEDWTRRLYDNNNRHINTNKIKYNNDNLSDLIFRKIDVGLFKNLNYEIKEFTCSRPRSLNINTHSESNVKYGPFVCELEIYKTINIK